jgi:hypothetical protein
VVAVGGLGVAGAAHRYVRRVAPLGSHLITRGTPKV